MKYRSDSRNMDFGNSQTRRRKTDIDSQKVKLNN